MAEKNDVSGEDSVVACLTCKRTEDVDFAKCLRLGWPKCHGATMRLVTTMADVGEATRKAMPPLTPKQMADLLR